MAKRGILRRCANCNFSTTSRQEFKRHERDTGKEGFRHTQNMSGVDEAKKYTDEEIAARRKAKYGNKI